MLNQKQSELIGSVQAIQELSRIQAASQLQPPVSTRTIQKYLEVASIFLPSFAEFQDPQTGYLNRFAKLNTWHLSSLQKIREYARSHGMKQLQIALSKNPEYFETGVINNVNNKAGSRSSEDTVQEIAERDEEKIPGTVVDDRQ